ncbi:putative bifunctional diguanylate cyclase/phosphodiesterase [Pseudaminobacter soli (ex Li et al. 2025)]|uniref:GGDEF-domain containing protein n=1 Tax=Pseudaminobacter soli (ex Li et al. 2025) TaxID=1295366 RepID=A0A2P7SJZ0_9HYPH|nr:GGDEF domain-containing phosphodiesterase [Mesorhizobium soli]PSJ62806.1 GGDEF-domain containing protein [Mesorhizobium soli]
MQLTESIAQRVGEAIARSTWKSVDPFLLKMMQEANGNERRMTVRWGMWAAVACYVLYGAFDVLLLPDVAHRLVAVRISVGVVSIALIEFGVRRNFSLATLNVLAALALVTGATAWLLFALETNHQAALSDFMVFGTVFVLGANLFFNFRFMVSAISSATVTMTFVAAALFSLQTELTNRLVLAAYFINSLVFSLYLSWRLGSERYKTFLHALQARIQEQAAVERGQMLDEIANTDALTGLRNRRAITRDFVDLCEEWASDDSEIGVVLIDVDYFKRFNDRLGHQAGDDCLVALANALSATAVANNAIAGRYGGEEFVVLCKVATSDDLRELSGKLCQAIEDLRIPHPNTGIASGIVTISAGASLTRADKSVDFYSLLQEADRALYRSKFAGRATFHIYDRETMDEDESRQDIPELLRLALEKQLVSVVYQPIYDVESGSVLGYETLMRLRNLRGELISPAVFIPVAEHTGAIVELGIWVIDQACRDMVEYGLGAVVSANVSPIQLKAPSFPLRIAEILQRHGLAPHKLALEVTEGIDIVPEAQAEWNIQQLRSLGVQIWLDDFGTGFAGLASIRRFEFDVVKIDRSFLHDCQTAEGRRMLNDMVRLLRNLGHRVLVEGVETADQQALLRRLGVHAMQGFLVGRPLPIETMDRPKVDRVA